MKIIVCVGDNGAMLFNNRRVSSDRTVTADIIQMVLKEVETGRQTKLWMNRYSAGLFEKYLDEISVSETFFGKSGQGGLLLRRKRADSGI